MNRKFTKVLILSLGLLAFTNVQAESLHEAVTNQDIDQIQVLIQEGADINELGRSWYGYGSPLHLAVRDGHQDIARLLIDSGAYVDVRDHNDYTPLHNAAWNGNLDMVKFLLDAGADINAVNYSGDTVLSCAQDKHRPEVIRFLEDKLQLGSN
jgi:ankyrin repeat protein